MHMHQVHKGAPQVVSWGVSEGLKAWHCMLEVSAQRDQGAVKSGSSRWPGAVGYVPARVHACMRTK